MTNKRDDEMSGSDVDKDLEMEPEAVSENEKGLCIITVNHNLHQDNEVDEFESKGDWVALAVLPVVYIITNIIYNYITLLDLVLLLVSRILLVVRTLPSSI